ncbi:DNA-binding protein [Stenotrophomonas maltophilia]|uniref:YobI family P-loop NTPase n=1 Tax=Stenotrophomonas maltophilia TaxID=40324 RepID=UPI0009A17431|nr:DNA-binding protein [Stenotrophomonas maltophilia]
MLERSVIFLKESCGKLRKMIAQIALGLGRSTQAAELSTKFIDLAPTSKADEAGVYAEALVYATDNPNVSNIALTGPYGSGKSSIIKSFVKKYRRPALQISLAAFLTEDTSSKQKVSKQEIERSILQQMLYGADANQLPLSRFKRIKSPSKWSILFSFFAIVGATAFWVIYQRRGEVIDGTYFLPVSISNWANYLWFAIGASFLWVAVYRAYKASFGVSLKSVSLKDIEITPAAVSQESILNRHLDEIIYFFQSTDYDLVIIEDLDRFNDSDIFVTLREINSLVNANAGVKRPIRFLYALRDDMFISTERTKFFEFIIPVIPIINSSNSIDKVLEQGKRLSIDSRLDQRFLREVSRYLNDLRLIHNIFNEYAIYVANLELDDDNVLDATKLLAVLIYKNVFPRDFESLHRGKGNLAKILARHDEFIARAEEKNREKIDEIEGRLASADRQVPTDLLELRRIYAMALVERLPASSYRVGQNGQSMIEIGDLARSESFDQIISSRRVVVAVNNYYGSSNQNVDISGLQEDVDSQRAFGDRQKEIQRRAADFKSSAAKKLQVLRAASAKLRSSKFSEIIRINIDDLDGIFEGFGEGHELARFLILEGHVDDTYYQYTSLFHAGRMSPNDNKFLIQIRGFIVPDPSFPIDNVKEVVAGMRDEDFRQPYVLNVKVVDCLLGNSTTYKDQLAKMFDYMASNFEGCAAFFASYYVAGAEVPKLLDGLRATWAGYVPAILHSSGLSHIGQVIAHIPEQALEALPITYPEVSQFVSENLAQILALGVAFSPTRLAPLRIEVRDLSSVGGFPEVARFLFEGGFYTLSIENLQFIFHEFLGANDLAPLRTQNFTMLTGTGNSSLISRIEHGFDLYLKDVLHPMKSDTNESVTAILDLLGREDADFEIMSAILERQFATIQSFDSVPVRFQSLVFQLGRIEASWENCLKYMSCDAFDAGILTGFLETKAALEALTAQPIAGDDKNAKLRWFLINNNALEDPTYLAYVKRLPKPFTQFPSELDFSKWRILIEQSRIVFSKNTVLALGEQDELQTLFVVKNIDKYLMGVDEFELDDDFRERLLAENIRDDQKLAVIQAMDLSSLGAMPVRAGQVGMIIEKTGANTAMLNAEGARAAIVNSAPVRVQISLFNKCERILSSGDVRGILAELPRPFSEINSGYHKPTIENNSENVEFVEWLKRRKIISSWKVSLLGDIRIYLFRSIGNR